MVSGKFSPLERAVPARPVEGSRRDAKPDFHARWKNDTRAGATVLGHKRLIADGVEFLNAPHIIHKHDGGVEEWMALFNDPEGRPLAIMSVGEATTIKLGQAASAT